MVNNYTLRKNARGQLGGGIFQNAWLLMAVACLIYECVIAFGSIVVVGSLLLIGPMSYGLARVTCGAVKGKQADMKDMITGFTENVGQTIILGIMQNIFILLWSILFVIPGIVKTYSYAMSFYLQQDSYDKDWRKSLDESKRMMDGHKWQLFCLDLSFIGWYIVGALCFGIGVLWVTPYHQTARANFYEALKADLIVADGADVSQDGEVTLSSVETEQDEKNENAEDADEFFGD